MAKPVPDCGGFKPLKITKTEFNALAPKKNTNPPKNDGGKKK